VRSAFLDSHQHVGGERVIVEHLWSRAGATGGNRSQTDPPRYRLKQAISQPSATHGNGPKPHGKEGVEDAPVDASADAIGHEDRVHILPGPLVVPLPEPFALEAELLVEPDRGLVPREHMQLELAYTRAARPLDRRLQ
jgi:hypothetical protein